jgi:hypothetical protein
MFHVDITLSRGVWKRLRLTPRGGRASACPGTGPCRRRDRSRGLCRHACGPVDWSALLALEFESRRTTASGQTPALPLWVRWRTGDRHLRRLGCGTMRSACDGDAGGSLKTLRGGTGQAPPFPANARLPSVIFLSVPVSQGASATFECLTADAQTVPCPWL